MNHAVAEEMGEAALNENPYLAGLTKKTRNLKKKMEKIRKTEELKEAGKNLNAEQLKLLETRPFVEAGLVEHDRIRSAMEAVALDLKGKEMEEAKLASSASTVATPTLSPDSIKALKGDANDGISTPSTDVDAPSEESTMESVGVATDPIPTEHASAQTELSGPPPPRGLDPAKASIAIAKAAMYAAKEKEEAEARGLATGRAEMETGLRKILGLLHATTWCNAKGKSLPTAIDFFSKVLLGQTVPPDESDFDDCLEQSVERAIMYLNPSNSSKEVAPGITFEKLDGMVYSLREDIIVDLTPKEPVFNFFPDLCPGEAANRDSVGSSEEPEGAGPSLEVRNIKEPSQRGSPVNQDLPQDGQFPMTPPLREPQVPSGDIKSQPSQSAAISDEESPANEAPPAMVKATSHAEPLPPQPLLTPATGDPSSMTRAKGHSVIQENVQSQSLISLGQQASQMEEGVLPPVVTQDQPRPLPVVMKEDGGGLPKGKEQEINRLRAPLPPPPICQGSSGGDAKTVSKSKVSPQAAPRQQQVWSPLGGTTSAGYAGSWGYPRVSQDVHHAQHKSYRQPVHADPTPLRPELNDETKRNVPAFPTPPHDASTPRDANRSPLIANGDVKECPTTISKPSPKKEENAHDPITAVVAKPGPAPTPPCLESSDQLSATPVSVSEETSGKPRGGRNAKGGVLHPRSRRGKRVEMKGGGDKRSDDIPGNKPTANSLSNSPPQSPSVAIALREQGPVEHVQRKGDAEKNGRSRRPRERGRGKPSQKQEEDRRAEGKQLEAQGMPRNQAAQGPVQDNRRTAPQEMDRGAPGLVKREAPTSLSTGTVPSKSPPQAPSSLSWAGDVPSNQPLHDHQQQRGGRGRNRRAWQRKSSEQRMQGHIREGHQGPAPSPEAGIVQQHRRNGNNQANVANGGRTGGRARNPSNMDVNGSNRAAFSGKHGRTEEESTAKAHTGWRSGYRKSGVP